MIGTSFYPRERKLARTSCSPAESFHSPGAGQLRRGLAGPQASLALRLFAQQGLVKCPAPLLWRSKWPWITQDRSRLAICGRYGRIASTCEPAGTEASCSARLNGTFDSRHAGRLQPRARWGLAPVPTRALAEVRLAVAARGAFPLRLCPVTVQAAYKPRVWLSPRRFCRRLAGCQDPPCPRSGLRLA